MMLSFQNEKRLTCEYIAGEAFSSIGGTPAVDRIRDALNMHAVALFKMCPIY